MLEFGKTLKVAREARGMTVEQVSEQTHMAAKTIRELEAEDFSSITAPIYGRGFVKLYCQAVGLEPKPLVDEFMEIFSGNRNIDIRERPTEPNETVGISPTEPNESRDPAEPATDQPDPEPPPQMTLPIDDSTASSPSRYAPPIPEDLSNPGQLGPAIFRTTLLVAVAAAILWGAFLGLRALYRSTSDNKPESISSVEPARETVCENGTNGEPAPAPATRREPQKIAPLYID